jgi:hypothetical protein
MIVYLEIINTSWSILTTNHLQTEIHITQKNCYSSQTVGNIQQICSVMYQQLKQYINERDCVDFTFARSIFAILK